jgi:hypothetical protein
MKKKMVVRLVAVPLLLLTYGLGYWSGFSHAQKGVRVTFALDTRDAPSSSGKPGFDPYFAGKNTIPDKVK